MDKKKKINYFADYKLKFISQLFLSTEGYIALSSCIFYVATSSITAFGVFFISAQGDLVHLFAISASSCGCAVVYEATLSGLFCGLL